jgi:dienelactone hydrolase
VLTRSLSLCSSFQGANDPRVKKAEADQIVIALRDKGKKVDYLLADDEGHGFAKPVNRMAMYAEVEKFLSTVLGGVYQKEMPGGCRLSVWLN